MDYLANRLAGHVPLHVLHRQSQLQGAFLRRTRLELDAQALRMLERAGLGPDSVPAAGQAVFLRSTANLSTGGTATDVTDVIHPDNREMAERAVRAIGLDVGGVDFLTSDITQRYRKIGGGICEVNAAPGFRMHVAPSEGTPRDVAGPVLTQAEIASVRVPGTAIVQVCSPSPATTDAISCSSAATPTT